MLFFLSTLVSPYADPSLTLLSSLLIVLATKPTVKFLLLLPLSLLALVFFFTVSSSLSAVSFAPVVFKILLCAVLWLSTLVGWLFSTVFFSGFVDNFCVPGGRLLDPVPGAACQLDSSCWSFFFSTGVSLLDAGCLHTMSFCR